MASLAENHIFTTTKLAYIVFAKGRTDNHNSLAL